MKLPSFYDNMTPFEYRRVHNIHSVLIEVNVRKQRKRLKWTTQWMYLRFEFLEEGVGGRQFSTHLLATEAHNVAECGRGVVVYVFTVVSMQQTNQLLYQALIIHPL